MKPRFLLAALLVLLAACGTPPVVDPQGTIGQGVTSSALSTTTSTTSTTDADSVKVCRSLVNELDRNGLGDLFKDFVKTKAMTPIAFATPLEKYVPVSAGAADPAVGSPLNDFNEAIGHLNATLFTKWSQDQVSALLLAYANLYKGCGDVSVELPWSA